MKRKNSLKDYFVWVPDDTLQQKFIFYGVSNDIGLAQRKRTRLITLGSDDRNIHPINE